MDQEATLGARIGFNRAGGHRRDAGPLPSRGLRSTRSGKRKICDRRYIRESGLALSD
jgi:hypothetical protein